MINDLVRVSTKGDRQTDKPKTNRAKINILLHQDHGTIFIAPDKAAYCVFTQFRGPENAIKFISMRT